MLTRFLGSLGEADEAERSFPRALLLCSSPAAPWHAKLPDYPPLSPLPRVFLENQNRGLRLWGAAALSLQPQLLSSLVPCFNLKKNKVLGLFEGFSWKSSTWSWPHHSPAPGSGGESGIVNSPFQAGAACRDPKSSPCSEGFILEQEH